MSDELAAALLEVMSRGIDCPLPEDEFNRLALEVFAHQFAGNAPYRAYCAARGAHPGAISSWKEVPALPTEAFKHAELTTVPPAAPRVEYRTSGTTRGGRAGRHLLPNTRLYDASLEPNFRAHLLPDRPAMRMVVLGPTAEVAPHSSLGHMLSRVVERFGLMGSALCWHAQGPDLPGCVGALQRAQEENEPVALLGTAFAFVHLLDTLSCSSTVVQLPPGSRLMDTGGYKGRSREVPKAELYSHYQEQLGIPLTHIVNEYGMTEMGSQFYDGTLREWARAGTCGEAAAAQRVKVPPPWVRTQVVCPVTLRPLPHGHTGLLRHFDLANLHTVSAIQTDDLGVARGKGFEILGRAAGAEARGCSLTVEDLLG